MAAQINTQDLSTPSVMLDPKGAGVYLGGPETPIKVATLACWRVEHKGPAYIKVGRLVRYRRSALDAWIEAQEQTTGGR